MNIVKCEEGHFFDIETYSLCPHCGKNVAKESIRKTNNLKKKPYFFGKKEKKEIKMQFEVGETEALDSKTEAISQELVQKIHEQNEYKKEKDSTFDFWNSQTFDGNLETKKNYDNEDDNKKILDYKNEQHAEEINKSEDLQSQYINARQEDSSVNQSVVEAIKNVSASEEGKTFGYFSLNRPANGVETQNEPTRVSYNTVTNNNDEKNEQKNAVSNDSLISDEPPVGWLVCIKGVLLGRCYYIYAGRNSVGRNNDNKIALKGDNCISREKHAYIVYEPRKRVFRLHPGNSDGLTYLNGDEIYEPTELKVGDAIELGQTTLRFVPLCGPDFSWEDYI